MKSPEGMPEHVVEAIGKDFKEALKQIIRSKVEAGTPLEDFQHKNGDEKMDDAWRSIKEDQAANEKIQDFWAVLGDDQDLMARLDNEALAELEQELGSAA